MRDKQLDILFEPLEMPNLSLKNRFFMAPLGTGFDIDQLTNLYLARAEGEMALITTGEICVHHSGKAGGDTEPMLEKDDDIKSLIPLVKAVQKAGAKIVAQLNHAGRYTPGRFLGFQSVAPSPIASRYTGETPRELSTDEIDDLVIAFANAAVYAQKAGFNGIEILGCSGYLISQFLSPLTNKREDKYGGDALQRATFVLSILSEARKRVGDDFNICVKFDGEDGMKGGRLIEDSLLLAPKLVEAGADRLHVWAGWHEASRPMLPMSVPRGAFSDLSAAIKKVVKVPVSTVGRINDPYVAADILSEGKADLIGLGRTSLCDPEFVKKTMEGRTKEIRRCIACCYCFDQIRTGTVVKCAANPEMGREGEKLIQPAGQKKHVVVVGAGPGGMEVARLAALRGHRVTLLDEKDKPGGMVNLAIIPPYKEELNNIIDYYSHQMEILDVDLNLGKTVTPEQLKEIQPDVVVLATGAMEALPDIPGIEGENVVTASDILSGAAPAGEKVVIIGGGMIGVETAEFLADGNKDVTVIEMLKSVATDIGPTSRWGLLSRVRKKVRILTSMQVTQVRADSVVAVNPDNQEKEIPADTVVVATELRGRDDLRSFLEQSGIEHYLVGSCKNPGQIATAIAEGFDVGCKI